MKVLPLKNTGNKGFSLVELIVIIAIMAIVTGALGLTLSMIFSRDAESVATTISDELTEARTMAMTKPGNYTMTIHCGAAGGKGSGADDNYITIVNDLSGSDKVEKTICFNARAYIGTKGETFPRTGSSDIAIVFNKVNGSVDSITVDGTAAYTSSSGASVFTIDCKAVSADKTASVELMTVSGKHEVVK